MEKEELKKTLLYLIEKEKSLTKVCEEMGLNEYEVLGLINEIEQGRVNISKKRKDDDIYLQNLGDIEYKDNYTYRVSTDDANEFKFIVISDTRLGSKSQQLSILNDIYLKGHEMGYNNVIHCGNISAGLPNKTGAYSTMNFLEDTGAQIDYIANNYPRIEGMKTYFITGKRDARHLTGNKVSVGKSIDELRDDLIFLGEGSCDFSIDNVKLQIFGRKLGKTYTVSYRAQQQIDSYRSEDKPDIILYGGSLQMEKFTYRGVRCISVPSVCATTKEMNDKRYSNTVGAWYVTVKTNSRGELESLRAINSPYYVTDKEDYKKAKVLRKSGDQ